MGPGQGQPNIPPQGLAALMASMQNSGGPQPAQGGSPMGGAGQAGGPGAAPQGAGTPPMPQASAIMGAMQGPKPATMPGATGDNTKPLMAAIQNLHAYMSMETDPRIINAVRTMVGTLTQLIQVDQAKASQNPANQQSQATSNMSNLPPQSGLHTPTPTMGNAGQ